MRAFITAILACSGLMPAWAGVVNPAYAGHPAALAPAPAYAVLQAAYAPAPGAQPAPEQTFAGARQRKPNVVVILADDLGWADLACYGNGLVSTPHLDRLAAEGMRFTDAYSPAPICSPSRASILTGRSPARLHFEFVTKPDGSPVPSGTKLRQPPYPRDLPLAETTLAEAIDDSYVSGFFGKWHLTQENDVYLGWGEKLGPLQQGFSEGSETRGSHPYAHTPEEKNSFGEFAEGEYPPDALTDSALAFLGRHKNEPFLLYYSMYYVHTPVRTRCRWLYDKYKRLLGSEATENQIRYAAFVETMDAYVGRLLQGLEEHGLAENTLVIFTSDNGGHPSYTDNGLLRGSKWNLYEGGIRVPMIMRWPQAIPAGTSCEVPVSGTDILPTVCAITGSKRPISGPLDGRDISSLLRARAGRKDGGRKGASGWPERKLYWHYPYYHPEYPDFKPQSAIRKGRYKLIYYYETKQAALYDLLEDPAEKKDLSAELVRKAEELKSDLFNELRSVYARLPEEKR